MNRHEAHGLSEVVLRKIVALYGYDAVRFGPVMSGYRNTSHAIVTNGGLMLNFILYKHEPDSAELIRRTNTFSSFMLTAGLPVRAPLDQRIMRVGSRYGSLYTYLPGRTIPWEAYSMKHIKLLGFSLARFHEGARGFTGELPAVEQVYVGITERMNVYFMQPGVRQAMQQKLALHVNLPNFEPLLATMTRLPGRQALHMDFVRSNLLFTEATVSSHLAVGSVELAGVLDLEKAAYGHVLFDIGRTLAFLLVDCPKPAEKVRKYFLVSGYQKRGRSQFDVGDGTCDYEERLEELVTMFLTYDFYKFLSQNPYESLSENHHFMRTAAMLKAREVLK